ncbi:hypothetical protein [Amycolatopsis sp. cmx-4-68]|uniref:hypothetical protein n=1 Tax=Amycolatopsis sp. cmx-4-68 TaxID=2790938 RepID=UPI00397DD6E0
MTEHLTRHSTDPDETRTEDVHGTGDTAEVPGQDRTDFRAPGEDHDAGFDTGRDADRDDDRGADQHLSTADLASASARPDTEDASADSDVDSDVDADSRAGDRPDRPRADDSGDEAPELIDEEKVTGFRDRWQNVQTGFVDDPKQAVRQADELVAAVISALATTFAEHKGELESQWQQGEPATEELRIALRRYRSFFDQLLPR